MLKKIAMVVAMFVACNVSASDTDASQTVGKKRSSDGSCVPIGGERRCWTWPS